jgi:hypothetical protein
LEEIIDEKLEWAKEPYFREVINDVIQDRLNETFEEIISMAQFKVLESIYEKVWDFLDNHQPSET